MQGAKLMSENLVPPRPTVLGHLGVVEAIEPIEGDVSIGIEYKNRQESIYGEIFNNEIIGLST